MNMMHGKAAGEDSAEKDVRMKGLAEEGAKLAKKAGEMQKKVREKNAKLEEADKENKRLVKERDVLSESVETLTRQLEDLKNQTGDKSKSLAAMQVSMIVLQNREYTGGPAVVQHLYVSLWTKPICSRLMMNVPTSAAPFRFEGRESSEQRQAEHRRGRVARVAGARSRFACCPRQGLGRREGAEARRAWLAGRERGARGKTEGERQGGGGEGGGGARPGSARGDAARHAAAAPGFTDPRGARGIAARRSSAFRSKHGRKLRCRGFSLSVPPCVCVCVCVCGTNQRFFLGP